MGGKIAAAVLAAVLLMASGAGVYVWATTKSDDPVKTYETAAATDNVTATVNSGDISEADIYNSDNNTENTQYHESEPYDGVIFETSGETDAQLLPAGNAVSTGSLSVARIVDTNTQSDVSAREVLGEGFESSYLKLNSDYSFEMTLGYKDKGGSYSLDPNGNYIINVVYYSGDTDKFSYSTDDTDTIAYIAVPYGEYEIYFGN